MDHPLVTFDFLYQSLIIILVNLDDGKIFSKIYIANNNSHSPFLFILLSFKMKNREEDFVVAERKALSEKNNKFYIFILSSIALKYFYGACYSAACFEAFLFSKSISLKSAKLNSSTVLRFLLRPALMPPSSIPPRFCHKSTSDGFWFGESTIEFRFLSFSLHHFFSDCFFNAPKLMVANSGVGR